MHVIERLKPFLGTSPINNIFGKFISLSALFVFFIPSNSLAQVETNFSTGGGVRIGDSTTNCDGTIEGAIRFDQDSSKTIDYCNGTSWLTL